MYFRQSAGGAALHILNIWIDPGSSMNIVLELCHGNDLVGPPLRLPASGFGYMDFDQAPPATRWPSAEPTVSKWLSSLLPADLSPLWLSFGTHPDPSGSPDDVLPRMGPTQSRPSGFLPVLSWESNLVHALNRPVLRMQGLPVRPLTQHQTLHLAVCCTFSAAKQFAPPDETLFQIVSQLPVLPGQTLNVHVFADAILQPYMGTLPQQCAPFATVRIYDPSQAEKYGDASRTSFAPDDLSNLQNPWLLWMRDSLSQIGIDAVQFVSHGYSSRGHGALAFAESPLHNNDRKWARFVGTREISMFLDQIGAWSAILTSPPGNYSVAGLRILQDELTDYVAGPVMLYEMSDDAQSRDLRAAYHYLFDAALTTPPLCPSISLYTHPDWKQPFAGDGDVPTRDLLEEFTLAGRLRDEFASSEEVPAWLAAGQRSLERAVARMSTSSVSMNAAPSARRGREEALRFTADLFAKFARDLKA